MVMPMSIELNYHAVPTNRPHQVTPHGDRPCRFLLVQGVGKYDRHPVDSKTWKG